MKFDYRAIDSAGGVHTGKLEAPTKVIAVARLMRRGLTATALAERRTGIVAKLNRSIGEGQQLSLRKLHSLTTELSVLIGAGLTVARSLSVLSDLIEDRELRRCVRLAYGRVREGASLSSALEAQGGVFPPFLINMVRTGEANGRMDSAFAQLTSYIARSLEVAEKVRSALVYPAILFVMVIITMILIATVVLPQFQPIFAQISPENLPAVTRLMMATSSALQEHPFLLLALLGAFLALVWAPFRIPAMRERCDRLLLFLPVLSRIVARREVGRFHRALGTLLQAGIPLPTASRIAYGGVGNCYVKAAFIRVFRRVNEGHPIWQEYRRLAFVPTLAVELTQIGEATGQLEQMLLQSADILERDEHRQVDRLVALLVPALTIGMGLLIALMIASVFLGIISINAMTA